MLIFSFELISIMAFFLFQNFYFTYACILVFLFFSNCINLVNSYKILPLPFYNFITFCDYLDTSLVGFLLVLQFNKISIFLGLFSMLLVLVSALFALYFRFLSCCNKSFTSFMQFDCALVDNTLFQDLVIENLVLFLFQHQVEL